MMRKYIKRTACVILMSGAATMIGMEIEHQSPEVEKILPHLGFRNQSPLQGMQVPQRRGSLPERRNMASLVLKDLHSQHSSTPEGTPRGIAKGLAAIASHQGSPAGTPNTNRSTPSGVALQNFLDAISCVSTSKEVPLENGWQEQKINAFKTDLFSKLTLEDVDFSTADVDRFKIGTIVYHVHKTNKLYKIVECHAEDSALIQSVVIDARGDAIEELRVHLTKEVEKEAERSGWTLENSTKE